MGRQINFFLRPEEELATIARVRERTGFTFVAIREGRAQATDALVSERGLFQWLARPEAQAVLQWQGRGGTLTDR